MGGSRRNEAIVASNLRTRARAPRERRTARETSSFLRSRKEEKGKLRVLVEGILPPRAFLRARTSSCLDRRIPFPSAEGRSHGTSSSDRRVGTIPSASSFSLPRGDTSFRKRSRTTLVFRRLPFAGVRRLGREVEMESGTFLHSPRSRVLHLASRTLLRFAWILLLRSRFDSLARKGESPRRREGSRRDGRSRPTHLR